MHPGLDGFLGGLALVGRQIVQDDDIAFVEGWCELLLDIGLEDAPVHRGIDDEGGACRSAGWRRRSGSSNARKAPCSGAAGPSGSGRADGSFWLSFRSRRERPADAAQAAFAAACPRPYLARRYDVGTILLARQQSFFEALAVADEPARQ